MKTNTFRIIALLAVSAIGAFSASAQQTKKGPYVTNGFWDNWYISAGAGGQMYFGEYHSKASSSITPAFDFSVGKWITPVWGARLQVNGLQAKSATPNPNNPFVDGPMNKNGYYDLKMDYVNYHADVLFNVSAAFWGYKESRVYEFIPFAGFGGISATNVTKNELAFDAGLLNRFRVSKHFDINLEFRGTLFNQRFDGQWGGSKGEGIGSITAGLTYKFGFAPFKRASELTSTDLTPYNNRIKNLEGELNSAKARQAQLERQLADAKAVKPAAAPAAPRDLDAGTAVFFPIGKSKITAEGQIILDQIVPALKEAEGKFVITGYADKETGSKARNMQLSQQRAQNVHDYLVSKGVNADKLDVIAKGSEVNPFPQPYLNRVVIVQK